MNSDSRQNTVLAAVDLSESSQGVVLGAARLAEKLDASLLLLHVVHESAKRAPYPRRLDGCSASTRLDDIATRMMAKLVDDVRARYPELEPLHDARSLVIPGLPGSRICEIAKRECASMIVMGNRRRPRFSHFLAGSTTEEVKRGASVPVTTIRVQSASRAGGESRDRDRRPAEPQAQVPV